MITTGLSTSRLDRMHRVLSGHIERKEMPALVALVSHNEGVHVETLGIPPVVLFHCAECPVAAATGVLEKDKAAGITENTVDRDPL